MLPQEPETRVPHWDWRLLSSRPWLGQEQECSRINKMLKTSPMIFKIPFVWFSVCLVAVNLWLFFRILTKLVLIVFAQLFVVSMKRWAFRAIYFTLYTDVTTQYNAFKIHWSSSINQQFVPLYRWEVFQNTDLPWFVFTHSPITKHLCCF